MSAEIKLPQIGEEIDEAVILDVLVSVGDRITEGDPVVSLESDKATTEVPASFGGEVVDVLVEEGQAVKTGDALIRVEETRGEEDSEEREDVEVDDHDHDIG